MQTVETIRNIAIIAHVDHGKTTLVDGLLKQSSTFRDNQAEMSQDLIMDSGDQEHERGITITAKQTSVFYGDHKINIIDTPGHADFGGEVERTLNMADGVLLVVDAQEGPMPQTKFVLSKALELGLTPVVVINKIDKPAARIEQVEDEISNLFLELATHDDQLKYPVYYAIAREGSAWTSSDQSANGESSLKVIFEAIVNEIPVPTVSREGDFQLRATSIQYDNFVGKYIIGRIERGTISRGAPIAILSRDGSSRPGRIEDVYGYRGLQREKIDQAGAGDIVALTGISTAKIGETIAGGDKPETLEFIELEKPTISMYVGPNTSPMKGREGDFTTSRQIGDRLKKELETNIALQVAEDGIGFKISGRGELHLSVLIETLRREGFELEVGRPHVITIEEDGVTKEPVEDIIIEVGAEYVGVVSQLLGARRAGLTRQDSLPTGSTRVEYLIPTRALIGLRNELMTATRGTAIVNSLPAGYQKQSPALAQTRNGALIAYEAGTTTPYALQIAEARGQLFVGAGTDVYPGMIVGLNARHEDLEINVCKAKHLTNMRSSSSDGTVQLTPHTRLSLEQSIDFLEDDEVLEVTPKSLRLRKRSLDANVRKRERKQRA